MKKLFKPVFLLCLACAFAACANKDAKPSAPVKSETAVNGSAGDDRKAGEKKEFPAYDNSIRVKAENVDLTQDINVLSVQELRLLRGAVLAKYGYLFMEADLRGYFSANTKWYDDLIYKLWDTAEDESTAFGSESSFTLEEADFVAKIDARIAELKKNDYFECGGHRLSNPANIVNLFQFKNISAEFMHKLAENNMAISKGKDIQLFHVYEKNDYHQIPNFITTDIMLQAFHMYFSYTLKFLEQRKFVFLAEELCLGMYNQSLQQSANPEIKDIAEYNAAFYAVAYYLLKGEKLPLPEKYAASFEQEIKNINSQTDAASEFLDYPFGFPYSQFKPRGHYTRSEELSKYFKAMQWLQLGKYYIDDKDPAQLKKAVFAAAMLNSGKGASGSPLANTYKSVFEPIVFLVGEPDNLSVMDIMQYLRKEKIANVNDALTQSSLTKINAYLKELAKNRNRIKPKVVLDQREPVNFMPARYLADNEIIQDLVDVNKNAERAFPRGLDVFAAFGADPALSILTNTYKDDKKWDKYLPEMERLRKKFKNYGQWNASVYNKWIESLLAMQNTDKSYPEFMKIPSWDKKNLNTSLASWTDLKHDTVLYGEQPMGAECGDGGPPSPICVGYVEPNIKFWKKMAELVNLTDKMLTDNGLMTEEIKSRNDQLKEYVSFLLTVSEKELRKEKLTEAEYNSIEYFGSSIEHFTLSVIDPDKFFDSWNLVQGPDRSVAVVADVYTRNITDCPKNGILHEGVGYADSIYVVVEIEGNLYLTKGAVFSYYEFVQPLNERLTDEEWQKLLEDNKNPPRPEWMKEIIINTNEPEADEKIFYSSGC